jgi:hypothetical protein
MNPKKQLVFLLILTALSIALLVYAKTHVGNDFIKQLG